MIGYEVVHKTSVSLASIYNRWSHFFLSLSVAIEMKADVIKFMCEEIHFGCAPTTGTAFASVNKIPVFVASTKQEVN
jgi:hypothetical protein